MTPEQIPLTDSAAPIRFIRLPEVLRRTGSCKASIYRHIKSDDFPKPVKIGPHSVAWVEQEVVTWAAERIRQRDEETT